MFNFGNCKLVYHNPLQCPSNKSSLAGSESDQSPV